MILFCGGIRFAQEERQIKSGGGGIVKSVAKEREVAITLTVFAYGLFNKAVRQYSVERWAGNNVPSEFPVVAVTPFWWPVAVQPRRGRCRTAFISGNTVEPTAVACL